jgi:hypothetical protein
MYQIKHLERTMSRGRHSRNWVYIDSGYHNDSQFEAEVQHEEPCEIYGLFGVVEGRWSGNWYVFWRPNRNHTLHYDLKVMIDPLSHDREIAYKSCGEAVDSITYWLANFVPPAKFKKTRPRDSQKNRCYTWEHKMARDIGPEEFVETRRYPSGDSSGVMRNKLERRRSHDLLQSVLEHICNNLGEKVPELKFRSGGSHSFGGTKIRLLPCHCDYLVLMHELAHVLHRRWGRKTDGKRHQSHGQEFVGIYAYLLIRFGEVEKGALLRHAVNAKIKLLLPEQYHEWATTTEKKAA